LCTNLLRIHIKKYINISGKKIFNIMYLRNPLFGRTYGK